MKLLEIQDIKTYNPKDLDIKVLRDDMRILAGWWTTYKQKGEFKYTEKEMFDLGKKIIKEIIERKTTNFHPENWKNEPMELYLKIFKSLRNEGIEIPENVTKYLKEKKEFEPMEWDIKVMQNETIDELSDRLKNIYELWTIRGAKENDEEVLNAYLNLIQVLKDKKIKFEPIEKFEIMTKKLQEGWLDKYIIDTKKKIDEVGNIILSPDYISWTGSSLYAKDRVPNDMDLVIRDKEFNYNYSLKLQRLWNKITGQNPCLHINPSGANWRYFPLYNLALVPVNDSQFQEIGNQEPGFANTLYEAEPRGGSEEIKAQAKQSIKEDKIEMFRFFMGLKPTRSAEPNERMTKEKFLSMFTDEDFKQGTLTSKKYQGVRHIVFRQGDRVEIWSEDGKNNTERFPKCVDVFKKLNGNSYIVDCEVETWEDEIRRPDELTTGYINSKEKADDNNIIFNIFTLMYNEGKDLHKQPEIERQEILRKFGIPQSTSSIPKINLHLNLVPNLLSNDKKKLSDDFDFCNRQIGSEGVVSKKANSVYYLDTNSKDGWIKWHKNTLLYGIVVERIETKTTGVYNYVYALKLGDYKAKKESDLFSYKDNNYIKIGKTFNVDIKHEIGDLIAVEFEAFNMVKYDDGFSIEVSAFIPRYIHLENTLEKNPNEANMVEEIVNKAERNGCFQLKVIHKNGEVIYESKQLIWEDLSRITKQAFEDFGIEIFNEIKQNYIFDVKEIELEKENPNLKFKEDLQEGKKPLNEYPKNYGILVCHYRGSSVHLDFRRRQNGYLEGETIMNQPEGFVTEKVDTIAKGREWTDKLLKEGKFRPDMNPNDKAVLVPKARQPLVWLNVREVAYPPETVGATHFEWGVFSTMDEGMVYPGVQRPYFKEFFMDMKYFKGRMVERLIGVSPEWDEPTKGETQWQCWTNMEDNIPYILSKRQRKDKRDYIPADEEKVISPEWESKIRDDYKWWIKGLSDSEKMNRLDLAFNDLIEKGDIKALPLKASIILKEKQARFILRWHWWKGQDVIRKLPSGDSRFELLIDSGKDYLDRWDFSNRFYGDPLKDEQTNAIRKQINIQTPDRKDFRNWMDWQGEILPESTKEKLGGAAMGNPNKDISAFIEIKDSGTVEWIEDTNLFSSFKFNGKLLKGYWVMRREDEKSDLWIFSKGKLPGEKLETALYINESETITSLNLDGDFSSTNINFNGYTYTLQSTGNGKLLLTK